MWVCTFHWALGTVHLSLVGHISILADRLPVSLSLNTSPRVSRHFHQSSFWPFLLLPTVPHFLPRCNELSEQWTSISQRIPLISSHISPSCYWQSGESENRPLLNLSLSADCWKISPKRHYSRRQILIWEAYITKLGGIYHRRHISACTPHPAADSNRCCAVWSPSY